MNKVPKELRNHPKGWVWFWKPQWYWFGWRTLIPLSYGHDEYSRRTLLLGWTVTGRVILPLWYCGDLECYAESLKYLGDV